MTYVASASTGTSWVFRYTVVADDRDDDGVSLERTAIRAYADADLSHNRINNDQDASCQRGPTIAVAQGLVEAGRTTLVRAG